MSNPAAFSGNYADLRFIKTRSVAAITVEIPIEQAAAFVAAFGAPTPGAEIPVAIARLDPTKAVSEAPKPAGEPSIKERRRFDTLPLSQQAAMRCNEPAFWRFLNEEKVHFPRYAINDADAAASAVRERCKVQSRSDIKIGDRAGSIWQQLNSDYEFWLHNPDVAGARPDELPREETP